MQLSASSRMTRLTRSPHADLACWQSDEVRPTWQFGHRPGEEVVETDRMALRHGGRHLSLRDYGLRLHQRFDAITVFSKSEVVEARCCS